MRQRSGDAPRHDHHTSMPSAGPVPAPADAPWQARPAAVTRRGVLRTGLVLGALATAGGVTAWTLLDGPRHPGRAARMPGPSGPPPVLAEQGAPARARSRSAPARPAGTSAAQQPLPMRYFGSVHQPDVYFTIDDGWFPSRRVLEIMKSEQVPVTTFLIADAAQEHLGYWRDFTDVGGRIENHTLSHPDLTRLPPAEAEWQWAGAQQAFRRWFGTTPTLGRPPYGAINDGVSVAARNAGLTTMVAWSAADTVGAVQTWNRSGRLTPGEIALTHWDPGVDADLEQLLAAARESSLTPAYLPETW